VENTPPFLISRLQPECEEFHLKKTTMQTAKKRAAFHEPTQAKSIKIFIKNKRVATEPLAENPTGGEWITTLKKELEEPEVDSNELCKTTPETVSSWPELGMY